MHVCRYHSSFVICSLRIQEELGKLDRLRFSLQLGNIKDYKESVLTLQNKVR